MKTPSPTSSPISAPPSAAAPIPTGRAALRTLSAADKRVPALEILRTVLTAPRFAPAAFEREKPRTIAGLRTP